MEKNNREWLKGLLNNLTLLRWVKKFSSDRLLEDNKMANEKFNISSNENSISILDTTSTKLLVTNSNFKGEEFVRFNMKQLSELIDVVGKDGELIIPSKSDMREMIAKVGNDMVIVCPLPQQDKKK
jgi:hypothetical protein